MSHLALISSLLLSLLAATANAAPAITNMTVRGFQIGGTTTVTIQGKELMPAPRLLGGFAISNQSVLEKSAANSVQMQVTLDADITPGLYNLRLANANGISNNVVVAVDRLPQAAIGPKIEKLPAAVHGQVTSSRVVSTSFDGKAGEQVLIEVEAQRLGAKLRPVVRLFDERRSLIGWAMGSTPLAGDTRLMTQLPTDGTYTIELNDLQYAGPNPGHFRLKVGAFQFVDMAFPPAVERGKKTAVSLVGNLPDNQTVDLLSSETGRVVTPWPKLAIASGMRPSVLVSTIPELIEQPRQADATPQQLPSIPAGVSGRIDEPGQEDVYRLAVEPGSKLRFEIFAERIGSPIDALLEVRNDKGGRLGLNDDQAGTPDSRLDFTVAKGVETIDVAIKDQVRRGGPTCIYRLVVSQLDAATSAGGFQLQVTEDTYNIRSDATKVFRVTAVRDGYDGPIRLEFDKLPSGVTATGTEIAAGSNGTLVCLQVPAATDSGDPNASRIASLRGTSVDVNPPITSTVEVANHPIGKLQPWLRNDVALAVAPANAEPFQIEWSQPQAETPLVLGTTFKASVKLKRPPGAIGPVQLALVSGQAPILVNGRPDANRVLRAERATVDIAIDAKAKAAADALTAADKALAAAKLKATAATATAKQKPDDAAVAKTEADAKAAVKAAETKRADAEKALKMAQAAIKTDATFNVIVPPRLEIPTCDLALKATLKGTDNRTVLAEVYTPVRRFEPLNPLGLKLSTEPKFTATLDKKSGAAIKLTGSIERKAGFGGDVTVSIVGQPGGVAVPKTIVKADKADFELELKFPANFKPTEVTTIRLFATGPPDPKKANIVVRTEIPLTIKILAADSPPS